MLLPLPIKLTLRNRKTTNPDSPGHQYYTILLIVNVLRIIAMKQSTPG